MSRRSGSESVPILHQPGILGTIARFWQRTYAADYLALGVLWVTWFMIPLFVTPFHRMFSLDNKAIQYPYAQHERVPVVWVMIVAGVVPFVIILAWSALMRPGVQKTQGTVLGLLVAIILTNFLTDMVKNAAGRPRPDLLSRCKPARGTPDNALVAYTVCTEASKGLLNEGWRSFPSGHSSFSFSGLGYLSLFLCGQMHVFRPRTDLGRCLIALAPLLCAVMIALSRLADYRHDVWDVTCGGLLGMSVAWFSYRRYYPALRSIRCDVAYDKADISHPDGFHKVDDEEQALSRSFLSRENSRQEENYALEETEPSRAH